MKIDISQLNKAVILASLFNSAKAQGFGSEKYRDHVMSKAEAEALLGDPQRPPYFDYLNGRVMKVDLGGAELDTELYDRDNGPGAAFAALRHLIPQPE